MEKSIYRIVQKKELQTRFANQLPPTLRHPYQNRLTGIITSNKLIFLAGYSREARGEMHIDWVESTTNLALLRRFVKDHGGRTPLQVFGENFVRNGVTEFHASKLRGPGIRVRNRLTQKGTIMFNRVTPFQLRVTKKGRQEAWKKRH